VYKKATSLEFNSIQKKSSENGINLLDNFKNFKDVSQNLSSKETEVDCIIKVIPAIDIMDGKAVRLYKEIKIIKKNMEIR
jgi:hypothetical protein